MEIEVKVGQVWRDTYDDDARRGTVGKRMIRITEVLGDTVKADVAADQRGSQPKKPRTTTLKIKTLRAGYELVEEPAQ